MAFKIGNFAAIPTVAEKQIMGTQETIIRTPTIAPSIKEKAAGNITKTDTTRGVDPWSYAGSLLFGVPGAIASGVMALQKDTPVTRVTGKPEDVAKFTGMTGGISSVPNAGAADPFGGALESIGTGLKYAGILIPVGLGVMLLSQVKGLFNFGR